MVLLGYSEAWKKMLHGKKKSQETVPLSLYAAVSPRYVYKAGPITLDWA
jgi:hypothetical protein